MPSASDAPPVEIRWLLIAALVGTLVTGRLASAFWFFDAMFSGIELLLWPTEMLLMALQNPVPWTEIAWVWALAAASNVALYVVLATALSIVTYPVRKQRAGT